MQKLQNRHIEQGISQEDAIEKLVSQEHIVDLAKIVARSPSYQKLVQDGYAHTDAYRLSAEEIATSDESELSYADRDLLAVTGYLGLYVQASHEVDEFNKENAGKFVGRENLDAISELKKQCIIPFNHRLKEFINTHPENNIERVASNLSAAYMLIFSRYNCLRVDEPLGAQDTPSPHEIRGSIRRVLNGMRHELAAEALLDAGNLEYNYETTVNDDARGIDVKVELPGYGWVAIDVKASDDAVRRAQEKHPLTRAVATGLDDDDFTGHTGKRVNTLSIPFDTAIEKSAGFERRICTATDRYKQALKEQRRRHQLGARSLK